MQYQKNGAFTRTLMFLHDEKGAIVGVGVKNAGDARFTHYYYAKNLQGDVAAIYRSDYTEAKGYYPTLVASYEYDPWGKVTSVKGSSGAILSLEAYPNHIAHVNPIRYRGYYYDNETGFYYLQSRYYDPVISRFINADEYASTGQDFLGCNMFAYCNNNPINADDHTGYFLERLITGIGGALVGAGLGALTTWITGGTPEEIGQAAKIGAFEGAIAGIFPEAKVFVDATDSIVTFLDLWSHGTSFLGSLGCGLLSFGASCVSGNTGDKFTDTVVDNTFGFSSSLISGVGTKAAQKEKAPSPGLPGNYNYTGVNERTENAAVGGYGHWVKCYW